MTGRLRLGAAQVTVPEDWEIGSTAVTGDLLFAREPERESGAESFRASAVLVREDMGAMDFAAWQNAVDEVIRRLSTTTCSSTSSISRWLTGPVAGGSRTTSTLRDAPW